GELVDLSTVAGVSIGSLILVASAAAAAVFGLISFVTDIRALGRFRRDLREVTDRRALDILNEAQTEQRVSSHIRLVSSGAIDSPAAFGWLRPSIVVPDELLSQPGELRLILLHETAHLARGDFALDTLARIVRTLFGWHPLVTYLFRTHAYWREAACDLAVLASSDVDRSAYAQLLLSVSRVRGRRQPVLVASMATTASQLTRRIETMTRLKNPTLTMPIVRRLLVFSVLAGVVTFTACSESTPSVVEAGSEADTAKKESGPEEVYDVVEKMPQIVGGLQAVTQSIVYPEVAKKEKIEGRVIVTFVVEKDGAVSNAEILQSDVLGTGTSDDGGAGKYLDAEALRAVSEIRFEPGQHQGKPVRVQMVLPISFKLN
ncbi:MAG: M56 family metallopeptidase, partial [Rhodothermales bacterium]|nr:M56 family metallopeptidase [Rhodothermales bacterium]